MQRSGFVEMLKKKGASLEFDRLESLLKEIHRTFAAMKERFPQEICCKPGCDDCCSAFFDVSFVEAEYARMALQKLAATKRNEIKNRALEAQQKTNSLTQGSCENGAVDQVANWRVRCPMLEEDRNCAIYEYRPLTCRVYGLPTSIGEKGHVCGFSGFDKGQTYPTIKLDQINLYLLKMSEELLQVRQGKSALSGDPSKRIFMYELVLDTVA